LAKARTKGEILTTRHPFPSPLPLEAFDVSEGRGNGEVQGGRAVPLGIGETRWVRTCH